MGSLFQPKISYEVCPEPSKPSEASGGLREILCRGELLRALGQGYQEEKEVNPVIPLKSVQHLYAKKMNRM